MNRRVFGSLTRISDLQSRAFEVRTLDMAHWQTGDYVEAEVTGEPSSLYRIEEPSGAMTPVEAGDCVIGALGERAATLEGVGSWRAVSGGRMHCLTNAGLLGRFTSLSTFVDRPISLDYRGHLWRGGRKLVMPDFGIRGEKTAFTVPTVLLFGTSMSAGKTTTGRAVIELLSSRGLDVTGAKLTGAGRYRDILAFRDAGATRIYDFVDAGLPSTVVDEAAFRDAIRPLLTRIATDRPDFLVAEAGASPLEPYNGAAAIDELGDNIRCTVLCASDPYAVVGVQSAFGLRPDLVSGPATTTSAARDLVLKLTGVRAFNILDPVSLDDFRKAVAEKLGLD